MSRNVRAKKPKSEKLYTLTAKQMEKVKRKVSDEITKRFLLLALSAMHDEIKAMPEVEKVLPEDVVDRFARRINRYAEHLDKHLIDLRDLGEDVYKKTGVDWRSW